MTTTSKGYGDYVVFVESKALRGRSKQEYLRPVRKLGEHHAGRELAGVTEREVFNFLVHRREVEKLRPSTLNQAVVALRMFYRDYLGKRWALWERFEIRRDHPLPVVLTRGETRRLLGSVRSGRFRAVLALIYHCGLRVGEAVALKPAISTRSAGWRASWKVRAAECAKCPSVVRWCSGCADIGASIATIGGSFQASGAAGRIAPVRFLAQWASPARP